MLHENLMKETMSMNTIKTRRMIPRTMQVVPLLFPLWSRRRSRSFCITSWLTSSFSCASSTTALSFSSEFEKCIALRFSCFAMSSSCKVSSSCIAVDVCPRAVGTAPKFRAKPDVVAVSAGLEGSNDGSVDVMRVGEISSGSGGEMNKP